MFWNCYEIFLPYIVTQRKYYFFAICFWTSVKRKGFVQIMHTLHWGTVFYIIWPLALYLFSQKMAIFMFFHCLFVTVFRQWLNNLWKVRIRWFRIGCWIWWAKYFLRTWPTNKWMNLNFPRNLESVSLDEPKNRSRSSYCAEIMSQTKKSTQ